MTRSIALGAPSTHWCLPVTDDAALSSSPHQQQSRSGAPTTVASQITTNHSSNESLVQCQLSPSGQVFAMLTQSRLQFWSALQHTVLLATVILPRCSSVAGGDAGHKVVWNPAGRSLAVATLDRRVIFVEADVNLPNTSVIAPDVGGRALHLYDVPGRVCLGFEIQLEFGLVIGLAAAPQALLVSTSSGFVVGIGWNRGSVLFTWSSTHVLQRAASSSFVTPTAAGGGSRASSTSVPAFVTTSARSGSSPTGPAEPVGGFGTGAAASPPAASPDHQLFPVISSTGSNNSSSGPSGPQQQLQHRYAFGGSIVFFDFSAPHRLCTFVLADGTFGFLRTSAAALDAPPSTLSEGSRHGICHTGYRAHRVVPSPAMGVVAISTHTQSHEGPFVIRILPFDPKSLEVGSGTEGNTTTRRGGGAGGIGGEEDMDLLQGLSWCEDPKALGGVRDMQWSNDGTLLAVCFRKKGVAVFHYTGICVFASFRRFEGVAPSRVAILGASLERGGCLSATWDATGSRLLCFGVDSRQMVLVPFSRIVASSDDSSSSAAGHTTATASQTSSAVCHGPSSVSWLQLDGTDEAGEPSPSWETVECPADYIASNFPIRFASASSDGVHVVCAGTHGAIILSRKLRRWRLFSVERQERQFSCVADPCWISDVMVALPVRNHITNVYEITMYPRFHLHDHSLVNRIVCDKGRPSMLAATSPRSAAQGGVSSGAFSHLLILEGGSTISVYSIEILADDLIAPRDVKANVTKVRCLTLSAPLEDPLSVQWCAFVPATSSSLTRRGVSWSNRPSHHADPATTTTTSAAPASPPPSPGVKTTSPPLPWLLLTTCRHKMICADISDHSSTLVELVDPSSLAPHDSRPNNNCANAFQLTSHMPFDCVFRVWCGDALFSPVFPGVAMLLTHSRRSITIWWIAAEGNSSSSSRHRSLVWQSATVADLDDSACLPIALLSQEGAMALVTEGLDTHSVSSIPFLLAADEAKAVSSSSAPPLPRQLPSVRRILFAHHAALRFFTQQSNSQVDSGISINTKLGLSCNEDPRVSPKNSFSASSSTATNGVPVQQDPALSGECSPFRFDVAVQRLREQGAFIGVMDFLLHLVLHSDDDIGTFGGGGSRSSRKTATASKQQHDLSGSPNPSAPSVSAVIVSERDRRALLWVIVEYLKRYWEYHVVVVGLVRKVDMSKWRLLFDVIGAPVDIFDDCLASGRFVEAAHIVRVVMMDNVTVHTVHTTNLHDSLVVGGHSTSSHTAGGRAPSLSSASSDVALLLSRRGNSAGEAAAGDNDSTSAMPPPSSLVTTTPSPYAGSTKHRVLTPLEAAAHCALKLFPLVLPRYDAAFSSELFRFLSMILMELCSGGATGGSSSNASGGGSGGLLDSAVVDTMTAALKQATMESNRTSSHAAGGGGGGWRSYWPFSTKSATASANLAKESETEQPLLMLLQPTTSTSQQQQHSVHRRWTIHLPLRPAHALSILFQSPHQQDNIASTMLLSTFPSVRESLTRELLVGQFLQLRLCTFVQTLRCFSIDLSSIVLSLPWELMATVWVRNVSTNETARAVVMEGSASPLLLALRRHFARQIQRDAQEHRGAVSSLLSALSALSDVLDHISTTMPQTTTTTTTGAGATTAAETSKSTPSATKKVEDEEVRGPLSCGGAPQTTSAVVQMLKVCVEKLIDRCGKSMS